MMNKVDVAIIGGGPGGLASAHAVLRAKPDAKVAVLEKRPKMERAGAGIVILPNGLRALSAICPEALERVKSRQPVSNATKVINAMTGEKKLVFGNPMYDSKEKQYGIRPVSIAWYQLQEDLAHCLPEPDILRLGSCVEGLEEGGGPGGRVRISMRGGEADIEAGLVIGADGFFSPVRQQILNDGLPTYAGSRLWRALVPRIPGQSDTSFVYSSAKFTLIYYACGSNTGCWVVSKRMPEPERVNTSSTQNNLDESKEMGVKAIAEVLQNIESDMEATGGCEEILNLIKNTDPKSVTTHGVYIRDPFANQGNDLWKPASGPFTLLGDAAHPMRPVGQGVGMALEDAAELRLCLESQGLTEEALRTYEERRIPRVAVVAQKSQQGAMNSYQSTKEEAERLEIRELSDFAHLNQDFDKEMPYDDWLNNIRYPEVQAPNPTVHQYTP
jgi:salicylate hydroxylase